jgi:hypothetical protein
MSEDKKAITPMEAKIAKLTNAFQSVVLPPDEDRELQLKKIVDICKVGNNINKELRTHPGVYAWIATQKVAAQDLIDRKTYQLRTVQNRSEMVIDYIGVLVRESLKLTVEGKKELISLIKLGTFKESSMFHNIDFGKEEENFAVLNENYDAVQTLLAEAEELEQELIDLKGRHAFLQEFLNCLGYQKNMCLRALVDRETSGLAQQTN